MIILHPYLQCLLSKHYQSKILPKLLHESVPITQEDFEHYWMRELSSEHRMHACFFAMPELVQMINETNGRLMYQELVKNLSAQKQKINKENEYCWNNSDSKGTDIQISSGEEEAAI